MRKRTLEESALRAPGVSDGIELDNDHGAILACREALGHCARVGTADVKEGVPMATLQRDGNPYSFAVEPTTTIAPGNQPDPECLSEEPDVGNPLVRFCEGLRHNWCMAEILWHRRETRRKTENTKFTPAALEGLSLLDKY